MRIAAVQIDVLPNRLTEQRRHWLPEEPLLGPDPLALSIAEPEAAVAHLCAQHSEMESARGTLKSLYLDSARSRLLRILQFCQQRDVHIVVLPEYGVPPSLIDVLVGFSSEMTIVAGLGVVRPSDLEAMRTHVSCELPTEFANCAVVVGGGAEGFVTKRHPADGEFMQEGSGPGVFEIHVGRRTVMLGVAICMDYIHVGHAFQVGDARPDVVAIPALSSKVDPFTPDAPRDFVRVIANHAHLGGTRMLMPRPSSPAFTDDAGTLPLHPGEEGVLICDFEGYQTVPHSVTPPRNRMVHRTTVLSNPTHFERGMVEALQGLPREKTASAELLETVDGWIARAADKPRLAGLCECLAEYKRLAMSQVLRSEDSDLLLTHLLLHAAQSSVQVRVEQARTVSNALERLYASDPAIDLDLRGIQTAYDELGAQLGAELDADPYTRPATTETRHTYFSFGLGRYDSDDAQATFPYQLDLLRAFSLSFNPDTTLAYRLTTRSDAVADDMSAGFEIIMGGVRDRSELIELVEQFTRAYRAVLLPGWSCYGTRAEIDLGGAFCYVIEPLAEPERSVPAIRADWGAVVDVVRAQAQSLAVELSCTPLEQAKLVESVTDASPLADLAVAPSDGAGSGSFGGVVDYLHRQDREHDSEPAVLDLRISIASEQAVSPSLSNTLGSMILGHDRFVVRELRREDIQVAGSVEAIGFPVRPDQAARIFHPPHGHIEGRGVDRNRPLRLHARAVPVTQTGCVIGTATAARAYIDTEFDLAIDPESRMRHVYVIGKTGSGKTNLLKNMVRQDIESGAGVAVIDPHGDLAEYALGHCGERSDETIYLDFGNPTYLPLMNPLAVDVKSEQDRLLATEELIEQFVRRSYHEWYGPRFEDTVRLALDTLALRSPGAPISILDIPGLLRNKDLRRSLLARGPATADLQGRWRVFDAMRETEQAEVTNWVLAKFAELEQSKVLRHVLGAGEPSVSLADVITNRKVLIARLPEVVIGGRATSFLGTFIVSRIARHIVETKADAAADAAEPAIPFFLYVDEFQKFVGTGFETLIPEARKFDLGLVLAHQNTDQLRGFSRYEGTRDSSVLTQILGNVGSILCFRCGSRDADLLSGELGVNARSLLQIGRYEAVARIVADGIEQDSVTIRVHDSNEEPGFPETRARVRRRLQEQDVLHRVRDVADASGDEPPPRDQEPL